MSYFPSFRTCLQCLLFASFFGVFSGAVHAAATQTSPVQAAPANEQIVGLLYTSQQTQLESIKERHRQEIETLREELSEASKEIGKFQLELESQKLTLDSARSETAAVGKRVDDSLIYSGQSLDRFGLWITIILASVGVVGYLSVTQKSKEEARSSAEQWFDNRATELQRKISDLEAEVELAKARISGHVDDVGKYAHETKVDVGKFAHEAKAAIARQGPLVADGQKIETLEKASVVEQRAEVLKDVPPSSYKYDDWNSLAFAAYDKGMLEEAALHWLKSSQVLGANEFDIAAALYNRGVAQSLLNQPEAAIATYDEVVRRFGDATELNLREIVSSALLNKGNTQARLRQLEAAMVTYDEMVLRFGDAPELNLRVQAATALFNKGIAQSDFGESEAAMVTYDELIHRFGDASESSLREQVAKALINKGVIQSKLGQSEAAIATNDEVGRRFGDVTEPNVKEHVASALVNQGVTLIRMDQHVAAVAAFDEVLHRFGDATELNLREQVAKAMVNKGIVQDIRNLPDAAISIYDEVLHRFGDATGSDLRALVALTMVNKGCIQSQQGFSIAAMETFDEVVERFSVATEPNVRELVAKARNSIGFELLRMAKQELTLSNGELAKSKLHQALGHFDVALTYVEAETLNGMILGNRAYALTLLGDTQQAEIVFAKALRAPADSGRALYEATLKDFDIHPVVQDQPMKELVERQWKLWQEEQQTEAEEPAA